MSYCKNCGVELEESMKFCPLCGEHVMDEIHENKNNHSNQAGKQEEPLLSDFKELTRLQRQKLFWELTGIVLLSGMIVTFIIDFIINKSVSWSKYPLSICLVIFINITLIVFWQKRIVLLLIGSFLSTFLLLLLLDLFNVNNGWGIKFGLPLLLCFYIVVLLLIGIVKRSKQRGINLLAYFLIASGILSLCIEGIISLQINNRLDFKWSVIVFTSVLPVSAIFLFIHYRLRKGTDLKSFFHI